MRVAVIVDAVGRDHYGGVCLLDDIADRASGVVVVAGDVGESPGISGRPRVGVRRAAKVQPAQGLALYACGRSGRGVRIAVVGNAIGRHRDDGGRLLDDIVHRAAGVVVVGPSSEGPGIAVVGSGVGVRSAAQVQEGAEVGAT